MLLKEGSVFRLMVASGKKYLPFVHLSYLSDPSTLGSLNNIYMCVYAD